MRYPLSTFLQTLTNLAPQLLAPIVDVDEGCMVSQFDSYKRDSNRNPAQLESNASA
jgi:hypothetical protein